MTAVSVSGSRTPRVLVHVGEPKTGTTFLQQVMWANRAELARQGVLLPGNRDTDHWRATQDLRGVPQRADDPAGSWAGDWARLAAEARAGRGTSVISHELLAALDAEGVARAVRSLAPAEVHVAVTVRDLARLLPAEWQETVKHRNGRSWQDWQARVIDVESVDPDRRRWWFWTVHDTVEILRLWEAHLPPERVHVVTVPPPDAPRALLWQRWAALLGLDSSRLDLEVARENASLGPAETELLRRLNLTLPADYPDWAYMDWVKERLAHDLLAAAPGAAGRTPAARTTPAARAALPPQRLAWARAQGERTAAAVTERGYDVVGDLADLVPPPPASTSAAEDTPVATQDLLGLALQGMSALLVEIEAERRLAAEAPTGPLWKQLAILLTRRHPALYRIRVRYWHAVEAVRRARRRAGKSVTV